MLLFASIVAAVLILTIILLYTSNRKPNYKLFYKKIKPLMTEKIDYTEYSKKAGRYKNPEIFLELLLLCKRKKTYDLTKEDYKEVADKLKIK